MWRWFCDNKVFNSGFCASIIIAEQLTDSIILFVASSIDQADW